MTTSSGTISYLNAAMNPEKLIAEAVELKAGKNLLTYDVYIRTEEGKLWQRRRWRNSACTKKYNYRKVTMVTPASPSPNSANDRTSQTSDDAGIRECPYAVRRFPYRVPLGQRKSGDHGVIQIFFQTGDSFIHRTAEQVDLREMGAALLIL